MRGITPHFFCMITKPYIEKLVMEALDIGEVKLVDIDLSPKNDIKVFIDSDKGVTADHCASLSRFLNHKFEMEFPTINYSLEVSSPGADRPLTSKSQYMKNHGRELKVALADGNYEQGKLISVDDMGITLEIPEIKKPTNGKYVQPPKNFKRSEILYTNIRSAQVIIKI